MSKPQHGNKEAKKPKQAAAKVIPPTVPHHVPVPTPAHSPRKANSPNGA